MWDHQSSSNHLGQGIGIPQCVSADRVSFHGELPINVHFYLSDKYSSMTRCSTILSETHVQQASFCHMQVMNYQTEFKELLLF